MDCSIRTVLVPGVAWPVSQDAQPKDAKWLTGEAAARRVLQYTLLHPWLTATAIKTPLTMGAVQVQKHLDQHVADGNLQSVVLDNGGRKSTIYASPDEPLPVLKFHTIRSAILEFLHRHPGSTSADIVECLGLKQSQVCVALLRLHETHKVRRDACQLLSRYWALQ